MVSYWTMALRNKNSGKQLDQCLAPYVREGFQILNAEKMATACLNLAKPVAGAITDGVFYIEYKASESAGMEEVDEMDVTVRTYNLKTDAYQDVTVRLTQDPSNPGHYFSGPLALSPDPKLANTTDPNGVLIIPGTVSKGISVIYGDPDLAQVDRISALIPAKQSEYYQPVVFTDAQGNELTSSNKVEQGKSRLAANLAAEKIEAKGIQYLTLPLPENVNLKDGISKREERILTRAIRKHNREHNPEAPKSALIFAGDKVIFKSGRLNCRNVRVDGDGFNEKEANKVRNSPFLRPAPVEANPQINRPNQFPGQALS